MSKNAGNIVLEARNVVYYYKANKGKKVLDDISYGFEIGKMYAILDQVVPVRQLFYRFWQVWILRRMGEFIMKG